MNQYIHQFEDGEYIDLRQVCSVSDIKHDKDDWTTNEGAIGYYFTIKTGFHTTTKKYQKIDDVKKYLFEFTEAWKTYLDWEVLYKTEIKSILKNIHDAITFNGKI